MTTGLDAHQSAPTCLLWPAQQPSFVFGLSDGKVKFGGTKGSKSQIVYSSDSFVVSLAARYGIIFLTFVDLSAFLLLSCFLLQSFWQGNPVWSC